jgi:K+-sensing histidine kinase KdpD
MTWYERDGAWLITGTVVAILIGMLLTLARDLTSASNLAFVFLIWTIVVAETGGRSAALTTAVISALSLNFFLTKPYFSLSIESGHDILAFVGLALCGVVAAAFGRRRHETAAKLSDVRGHLDVIDRISRALDSGATGRDRLTAALEICQQYFGLGGVVLRDGDGQVLAAIAAAGLLNPSNTPRALAPDTLLVADAHRHRFGSRGIRLPAEGGRLPVLRHGQLVATLDLWERDDAGMDHEQYKALSLIVRLVAAHVTPPDPNQRHA